MNLYHGLAGGFNINTYTIHGSILAVLVPWIFNPGLLNRRIFHKKFDAMHCY